MASDHLLTGRTAVVIGGTGGIGSETCRALAREGASIVLGYHSSAARAAAVIETLPGQGHRALQVSIEDSTSIERFRDEVTGGAGRVDILINAAGATHPVAHADLDGLTDDLIDSVFTNNWRGVFATIRAFAPTLRAAGDGLIVNVSSIAAFTGIGSSVAYCSAKAGLDMMTVCLARALAPQIRVLGVSPGVVDTTFVPGRGKEFMEKAAATTPLKRITTPVDVAEAILGCATNLRFSTGISIAVDGGRHL